MSNPEWTAADEAEFKAFQQERESASMRAIHASRTLAEMSVRRDRANQPHVRALATRLSLLINSTPTKIDALALRLAGNAPEIRALLLPFDKDDKLHQALRLAYKNLCSHGGDALTADEFREAQSLLRDTLIRYTGDAS